MKRMTILGLVLLTSIAIVTVPASAEKVKHPSTLKFPKLELSPPSYEELRFDNGMTGFFIEDHEIPVVNIYMIVKTSYPQKARTGLNSLAAWTIRNGGSGDWPADRINDELEFVDSRMEFSGGGRSCSIRVNCLKKDLELCLSILGDVLMDPLLPEDKIQLRRETMLENIRRENDEPRRVARREFDKIIYGDHPMAWQPTEETVGTITRDDVVQYHQSFFHPNNTLIGISGDVTRDEIVSALDQALAGWEPVPVALTPEPDMELRFDPSVSYAYKDINQAVIMMGHLGLNRRDENRPAVTIMNFILGGGSFTSWITETVRSNEGLAYSAYSRYTDDPWQYGMFVASSQTRSEAAGRAMSLIIDLIERMKNEGPTEEEVEMAKDRYLNAHVFDYESEAGVVQRLVSYEWQGIPLDTAEREIEEIGALTVADIKRAAQEYLHPDGLAILVVGDQAQLDQPLSNFGEVKEIALD